MIRKLKELTKDVLSFAQVQQEKPEQRLFPYKEKAQEYKELLQKEFLYDDFYCLEEGESL